MPVAISAMLSLRFARGPFGRPKADSKAGPLARTAAGLPPRPIRTLKRTEAAFAIWQASQPAVGTPVETYLCSRGLHVSPPSVLHFHAGLKHPSGSVWPAMVAMP